MWGYFFYHFLVAYFMLTLLLIKAACFLSYGPSGFDIQLISASLFQVD